MDIGPIVLDALVVLAKRSSERVGRGSLPQLSHRAPASQQRRAECVRRQWRLTGIQRPVVAIISPTLSPVSLT